jgi:hypothetical protein
LAAALMFAALWYLLPLHRGRRFPANGDGG